MGFSGRINGFIALGAVGFIIVIAVVILAETVPETVIFSEIIHFLPAITADFGNIVVTAVVVFTVIGIPAVAAGGVPTAGTASRVAAKRAGVTGEGMRISGNTISRAARRTGNVRSVILI